MLLNLGVGRRLQVFSTWVYLGEGGQLSSKTPDIPDSSRGRVLAVFHENLHAVYKCKGMKLAHRLFIKQSYKLFDCKKILFTNQKFFGRSYLQGLCLFFKFILSNFRVKQDNHNVPRTTGIKSPMPYWHHIKYIKAYSTSGGIVLSFPVPMPALVQAHTRTAQAGAAECSSSMSSNQWPSMHFEFLQIYLSIYVIRFYIWVRKKSFPGIVYHHWEAEFTFNLLQLAFLVISDIEFPGKMIA